MIFSKRDIRYPTNNCSAHFFCYVVESFFPGFVTLLFVRFVSLILCMTPEPMHLQMKSAVGSFCSFSFIRCLTSSVLFLSHTSSASLVSTIARLFTSIRQQISSVNELNCLWTYIFVSDSHDHRVAYNHRVP